jgi:hypothetical protein
MKLTISTLLLTVFLAVTALAQDGMNAVPAGTLITPALEISGMQTAEAEPDGIAPMFRGNTFMFAGANRTMNYSLSVSLDYAPTPDEPQSFDVANGSWTLSVFRDGNLVGTVFGDIPGGGISETRDESDQLTERAIDASFRVQGGTGEFEYMQAEDEASGSFIVSTPGEGPDTKGQLHNIFRK